MKINRLASYIIVFALAGGLFSCDDYLDIKPKGSDVLDSVEKCALLFNYEAIHDYDYSNIRYLSDNDWMNPTVVANNMAIKPFILFNFIGLDPVTNDRLPLYTAGANSGTYTISYIRINRVSNIILSKIGNFPGDPELRKKTIAEAKALRAYSYFVLITQYAKMYDASTASDLSIPLILEFDLETYGNKQATVGQVYQAIEKDLDEAIPDLSNTPANQYHFSKAAGYALKAKVHLFKREFDKAKAAATESYKLNNSVFDLIGYNTAGMNYRVLADNPENLYFAVPSLGNSSTTGAISPDLYSRFDTINDVRFTGFFTFKTSVTGTPNGTTELQRGDSKYAPGWDINTAGGKNYTINAYGIRTTDVILMLAECAAREGDFDGMKKYLDEIRKKRIKGYTSATENPANWVDAVKIVIEERRKEFLFGYHRYWDLKRLNMEPEFRIVVTKTIPANPNYPADRLERKTYTIAWDSPLWEVPLPVNEFGIYPGLVYNTPY